MRGRAGSDPEMSVFPNGISVSGLEILPHEHFSPVNGMNSGGPEASSCIACCIFHIIPFNCSDTALRVAEAMIGAKVIILVFHHVCCFTNLAPELVPRIFGHISSRKPG